MAPLPPNPQAQPSGAPAKETTRLHPQGQAEVQPAQAVQAEPVPGTELQVQPVKNEEPSEEVKQRRIARRVAERKKQRQLARQEKEQLIQKEKEEVLKYAFFPEPVEHNRKGDKRRLLGLILSAIVFIGIPTLFAIYYYGVVASDQYVSNSHYVIKSRGQSAMEGLPILGLVSSNSPSQLDMIMVKEYIESKQILRDLEPYVNIREIYEDPNADWYARLKQWPSWRQLVTGKVFTEGWYTPITEEDVHAYWLTVVAVYYDNTSGVSELSVRAFTPEDSKKINDSILKLSEGLVNRLSMRSQNDALSFARQEVADAHVRALSALDKLQELQQKAKQVDPKGYAAVRNEIQANLESRLTQLQGQLDILRRDLPEDAPGIQQIKNRIVVIKEQLLVERLRSTKESKQGEESSAAEILNEFGKRQLEVEFASQAYMSALSSLERARIDALQQSRYLEPFVSPHAPESGEYPSRLFSILLVFFACLLIWGVARMLLSVVWEHL